MAPKRTTKATKKPNGKPIPSPTQLALQKKLAITPKTAGMLIHAGYNDYRDLRHSSPKKVMSELPLAEREAKMYLRPLRRMVWLATQDEPELKAVRTAHCTYWTMKGLIAKGVWQDDFDDLTGEEINAKFVSQGIDP